MDIKTIQLETNGGQAIFEGYYGHPLNVNITSPLNPFDTNPSFIIYWCNKSDKLKYHDHGEGDVHGDAIDFVKAYEYLSTEDAIQFIIKNIIQKVEKNPTNDVTQNRMDSVNEVARTNQLNNSSNVDSTALNGDSGIKQESVRLSLAEEQRKKIEEMAAKVNAQPEAKKVEMPEGEYMVFNPPNYFGAEHSNYLNKYIPGDSKALLEKFDVKCVKKASYPVSIGDNIEIREVFSSKANPVFMYQVGEKKWKRYSPLSTNPKYKHWHVGEGEVDDTFIFGLDQVDVRFNYVIWCAGMKDTLGVAALGLNAICVNSERAEISYRHIDLVNEHFGCKVNFFSLYDDDRTGKEESENLKLKFGTPPLSEIIFNKDFNQTLIKDFSDVMAYYIANRMGDEITKMYEDITEFVDKHSSPEGNIKIYVEENKEDDFILNAIKPPKPRKWNK